MLKILIAATFVIGILVSMMFLVPGTDDMYAGQAIDLSTSATVSTFTFTDDPVQGKLTLDNDVVRVVWHYRTLASEYSNRGGGSIYELYDKRTDPGLERNIVAVVDGGGGSTSPNMPGIGGLGATHVWSLDPNAPATSDVGRWARLLSRNHYIDSDGNAVFEASFIVKDNDFDLQDANPDDYRVDKRWTVYPGGQIHLEISMEFLRSFFAAEPAYDFSFSRQYGWQEAEAVRHGGEWRCGGAGSNGIENPNNETMLITGLDTGHDHDYQIRHSEHFNLTKPGNGSSVRIKMDNNGNGFEGGGLFALGQSMFGDTSAENVEFSSYSQQANGHTVRYTAWWGGSPPPSERHKLVTQGTRWSDTFWIELVPQTTAPVPQVSGNVAVTDIEPTTAALEWSTNLATDARVRYWADGSQPAEAVETAWSPEHRIMLTNLMPATTYQYEVISSDGSGEAASSGSFTTTSMDGVYLIVSLVNSEWPSYADYLNGDLKVRFRTTNVGIGDAVSTSILSVSASSGVEATPTVTDLGPVASGGHVDFDVMYHVPPDLTSFSTVIHQRADDADGQQYYFPKVPSA